MKPMLLLGSVWLIVLFKCTKEDTFDQPIKNTGNNSDVDWDSRSFKDSDLRNRWNFSTTLRFDEWWFYTTRRPVVSYKDFPGKPGVATWKEISPNFSTEDRKSKKPTAEQVSSGSSSGLRHSMVHATLIALYYIPQWLFIIVL